MDRVGRVTGPAKGMDSAITRAIVVAGADLILVARDSSAVEPLAAKLRSPGRHIAVVHCDVTREADVDAVMA